MAETRITIQGNGDVSPEIAQFITDLANNIPVKTREVIDESTPRGRIYRRGGIRGRFLKSLRRAPGTKTRAITGSRFHRASAKGQPPAKDSGELYRRIRVLNRGGFAKSVRFDAPHAGLVEETRPFIDESLRRAIEATTL
jgi:hypothetical protein